MRVVLHLRVIAPSELRDQVLQLFDRERGITHVVLHRDAGVDPAGDVITADITRETANDVIKSLKALRLDRHGAITMEAIDTVVSRAADLAEKKAPGDPADALVWDELIERTREESTLNLTFVVFLCLACLISAIGVVNNSPVTVVGAMVLGPEFGPLAALSVALVRRRIDLARRAAIALAVGYPVAMLVTALATLAGKAVGWLDPSDLREASQVDFIFQVGPLSAVVALLAGAAGMLSLTSSKLAALVGMFISVTTIPAAGSAVVAAISGAWDVVGKSVAQLVVNLIGITVSGVLVLTMRRQHT